MGLGAQAGAGSGPGMGHNGGPSVEPGQGWRTHCWRSARAALLPTLPVEVVRMRLRRAAELGLDYRTYAGVRAQTGQDVVAFLFSSNALRVSAAAPALPADRTLRLAGLRDVARLGLAVAPLRAAQLAQPPLDGAQDAPGLWASPREQAARLRAILGRIPGDRVLLVGETALERDWCLHGRLAGWLPASGYFGP